MPPKTATISRSTKTIKRKSNGNIAPKRDRLTNVTSAVVDGNAYEKVNGEWVLVKKNVNR